MIERLESENLLQPLTFDHLGLANGFISENVCGTCMRFLYVYEDNGSISAACPQHGPIMPTGFVSKATAEYAEQHNRAGRLELRKPKKRRSEKTILSELGFDMEEPND